MWRVSSVLALNGLSTPFTFSDEAKERGTAVHAFVEHHARGITAPLFTPEVTERAKPFVSASERWFADFRPDVLFSERRVVSKQQRCTGRIDLGVGLHGKPTIVDVKSGGHSAWHGIQVCGYVDLANADPELSVLGGGPWQRAILYLHDDGSYRWFGPLDLLKAGPHDAYLWRAALALTCWKYDHGYLSVVDRENPDDAN